MGRSLESTQPILTVEQLIRQVRVLAEKFNATVGDMRWYLFGSALYKPVRAADVDLLVICQNHSDADAIRQNISEFALCEPIDLSILTEEEETEIGFVANQGCVQVFPICQGH